MAHTFGQNTLLKAGINFSSVAGVAESGSLTGYHVGIGGLKSFSENIGLKTELIFSQQGTQATADYKLVYYYLNMPLLLNVRLGDKFSFDLGPQLGVALRALEKGERDRDITANLNTLDMSGCLGVSYLITQRVFAEARYNVGITDLSRIDQGRTYRNAVFQGSVGYYFNRKNQ